MRTPLFMATVALFVSAMVFPAAGTSLDVHTQDDISYVSGGIGADQRAALQSMRQKFNLQLTLAAKDGHLLGGGAVQIQDAQGQTVLDTVADGPLFLAQLKPGAYTVKVSRDGQTMEKKVQVGSGGARQVLFAWSAN